MAFLVQTNPPTDEANAYITVAYFREYHADRGRDLSDTTAYPDAKVQAAIVKATQYLDIRFEFVGYKVTAVQATEWPRSAAFNCRSDRVDGIPRAVQQATAEYAYRALTSTSELLVDPETDGSGQRVKSRSETVGPLKESVTYSEYGGFALPIYPMADRLLTSQCLTIGAGAVGGFSSGDIGR